MAINYVVTKKVDTTKGETNVRYYATTRALQKKPVDSAEIARQLAEKSSLQDGGCHVGTCTVIRCYR